MEHGIGQGNKEQVYNGEIKQFYVGFIKGKIEDDDSCIFKIGKDINKKTQSTW